MNIAVREGDSALEMRTLTYAAQVEIWHQNFREALDRSTKAIELARAASDPRGEVSARYWAFLASRSIGDLNSMRLHSSAILTPAQRLRDRYWLATAFNSQSWMVAHEGDFDLARKLNQRGLDQIPMDPRILTRRVMLESQTGNREAAFSHLNTLEEVVRRAEAGPTTAYSALACSAGFAASIFGDASGLEEGEAAVDVVLSSTTATPYFSTWARIGASLLAMTKGDVEMVQELYSAMKSGPGFMVVYVSLDRIRGLLALTMGDLDQAELHMREAGSFCRKAGFRPEIAWTCHDHATVLLPRLGPGDSAEAAVLVEQGLSIATELGMPPLADRLTALNEQIKGNGRQADSYPDGLSLREVEVLRLIYGGKTDREIGEELVISARTVGNHVSNILNKTAAANRTEAATYAAQQGIA